jgi:hypothetical protein
MKIVLRHQEDGGSLRHLEARRTSGGGIVIEGQDLGASSEYEWGWRIAPGNVAAASAALGGTALGGTAGNDVGRVLPLLKRWFDANGGLDPGTHLREAGVPIEFWSRVGE